MQRLFRYTNVGLLATTGKRTAIVDFGRIELRGRLAWWVWSIGRVYILIGLLNRLAIALNGL